MNEPSQAELDDLIAQATVDCYNEDEELTGFATMIGDNLAVPFGTMHREHPRATRREIGGTIIHQHAVGRDHRRWYLREVPDLFTGALRGREG